MPISLPPISRRKFLAGAATLVAGAYIIPTRWAMASPSADPNRIALISDIHIPDNPVIEHGGVNMTKNLQQVCNEVLAIEPQPGSVLINGDCAFGSGQPGEYSATVGLLKPLRDAGLPLHLSVGNHDNRENFWNAMTADAAVPRPVANRQIAIIETPLADWFMLDSLDVTGKTPGKLGEKQLDWLAHTLDQRRDKPVIVMVHHHPDPLPEAKGLTDTLALFDVISQRRQVKAPIFGHTHFWEATHRDDGIHLINLPPTAYVFVAGKPNGWVDANLTDKGMNLQLLCIDKTHKNHGQKLNLDWRTDKV